MKTNYDYMLEIIELDNNFHIYTSENAAKYYTLRLIAEYNISYNQERFINTLTAKDKAQLAEKCKTHGSQYIETYMLLK